MCSQVRTLLKLQHARESSVDLVKKQVLIQWVGRGLSIRISNRLQGNIEAAFPGTTHWEARGQNTAPCKHILNGAGRPPRLPSHERF